MCQSGRNLMPARPKKDFTVSLLDFWIHTAIHNPTYGVAIIFGITSFKSFPPLYSPNKSNSFNGPF